VIALRATFVPLVVIALLCVLLVLGYFGMRFMRRVLRLHSVYIWEARKSLLRLLHHEADDAPPSCFGLVLLLDKTGVPGLNFRDEEAKSNDIAATLKAINEVDVPRLNQILSLAGDAKVPVDLVQDSRLRMRLALDRARDLVLNYNGDGAVEYLEAAETSVREFISSLEAIHIVVIESFAADLKAILESRIGSRSDNLKKTGILIPPIDNRIEGSTKCRIDAAGLAMVIDSLLDLSVSAMRGHEKRILSIRLTGSGARIKCEISDTGSPLPSDLAMYRPRMMSGKIGGRKGLSRTHEILRTFECRLQIERDATRSVNLLTLSLPRVVQEEG